MNVKAMVVERFEEIISKNEITQNRLATLSGVTPSTVYSLFDNDREDVSITTMKKLCDGLDVTLGELFTTTEFDNLEQEIK